MTKAAREPRYEADGTQVVAFCRNGHRVVLANFDRSGTASTPPAQAALEWVGRRLKYGLRPVWCDDCDPVYRGKTPGKANVGRVPLFDGGC
jgi:hypothetical protein